MEATPEWKTRRETYETALSHFEARQWPDACRTLYPLLSGQEGNYDLPALTLLGRAIECIKSHLSAFDPVLELKSK